MATAAIRVEYGRPAARVAPPAQIGCVLKLAMNDKRRDLSDAEAAALVRAIAERRDRAAFATLFEFYAGRLKAWTMRSGAGAEAAEEIAQEALLTVWRKADLFSPDRASVSAWLFAIARNLRIDRARREQRARQHLLTEVFEEEDPDRPDGLLDVAEREDRVRGAISELPDEQLSIVRLSFFEGKAHGEIAEALSIPLGTVKSRLRLAMVRLRKSLGDLT